MSKRHNFKNLRKAVSLILSLIMFAMCCLPSGALPTGNGGGAGSSGGGSGFSGGFNFFDYVDGGSPDFVSEAIGIIAENWNDDYFMAISMELDQNELSVDGKTEYSVNAATVDDGELLLPALDIAAALGVETGDDGAIGGIAGEDRLLIPADEVAEAFNLDVRLEDEKVLITKPYQLKQLTLYVKDGKKLRDLHGAVESATNGKGAYFLQYPSEEAVKSAYDLYLADPRIQYVSINKIVLADALPDSWGAERIYSERYAGYLEAESLTGEQIVVAVVDTGVDALHEHLKDRMLPGYNFDADDDDPYDKFGHGTHVAGIITECTPANVAIMPVKVLSDDGWASNEFVVSFGIKYAADNDADIINLSLGGFCDDFECLDMQAIEYAARKNVVSVVAAGNWGVNVMEFCPSKSPYAITVAATDVTDAIAGFSNHGEAIDLAAPGVDILSSFPQNRYKYFSGTSMAAPHVSAGAAMLLMEYPEFSPQEIKDKLKSLTSDFINDRDNYYGVGILDFNAIFNDPIMPGIRLDKRILNVETIQEKYRTYQLRSRITPLDSLDRSVEYVSNNENVAVCDEFGKITVTGVGLAVITATAAVHGLYDTCAVNVTADDSMYWMGSAAGSFAGGDGTWESPYQVATAEQLALVAKNNWYHKPGGGAFEQEYFELTDDIDLHGKEWISIGYNDSFQGHFNGNGHIIKNMTQNPSNIENEIINRGLFGVMYGCKIKGVGVTDAFVSNVTPDITYVTGIFGYGGYKITLADCFTTGECSGSAFLYDINGEVFYDFESHTDGVTFSKVMNCYSTATATDFINTISLAEVSNCYFIGGAGFIDTSYNGFNVLNNKIVNCFYIGTDWGRENFVAYKSNTDIKKCYYYSGNEYAFIFDDDPSATDLSFKTPEFFRNIGNFTHTGNWDITSPWDFNFKWGIDQSINSGYPYLTKFHGGIDKVETPEFLVLDDMLGCYVKIKTDTTGATIYFTIDGTMPTESSEIYGPDTRCLFREPGAHNVKAYAVKDGMYDSDISEVSFTTEKVGSPYAYPYPGLIDAGSYVELYSYDPDSVIYYSTNGIPPSILIARNFYENPIQINKSTTVMAIAYRLGYNPSDLAVFNYDVIEDIQVKAPEFTVTDVLYGKTVRLRSQTGDADIYYTMDGSDPLEHGILYGGALLLLTPETFTIKAVAKKGGMIDSQTTGMIIDVEQAAAVTADPPSGTLERGSEVKLSSATPGSIIYFTTDGSYPDEKSNRYIKPLIINNPAVIRARAYAVGCVPGEAAEFRYEVKAKPQTALPWFTIVNVINGKDIYLNSATEGAQIFYTLDGSNPAATGALYDGCIRMRESDFIMIKAVAVKNGMADSQTAYLAVIVEQAGSVKADRAPGEVEGGAAVALTTPTPDAVVYFTTDGSSPNERSEIYKSPIVIEHDVTIRARAYRFGMAAGEIASFNYEVSTPAGGGDGEEAGNGDGITGVFDEIWDNDETGEAGATDSDDGIAEEAVESENAGGGGSIMGMFDEIFVFEYDF